MSSDRDSLRHWTACGLVNFLLYLSAVHERETRIETGRVLTPMHGRFQGSNPSRLRYDMKDEVENLVVQPVNLSDRREPSTPDSQVTCKMRSSLQKQENRRDFFTYHSVSSTRSRTRSQPAVSACCEGTRASTACRRRRVSRASLGDAREVDLRGPSVGHAVYDVECDAAEAGEDEQRAPAV